MRLRRLELVAFGPFTGAVLAPGDGLTLVLGPNEAGKSSALRGLGQFLYGMPRQFADNFVHQNKDVEIRGLLEFEDGGRLELRRQKKDKNDLVLLPDLEPLDQRELVRRLGGVDQGVFGQLFGIGHAALAAGSEDLLRSGGALGQNLFAAASGVHGLRRALAGLDEEARRLFAPRARTSAVNAALAELRELRAEQRELSVSPAAWAALNRDARRLEARRGEIQARLDTLRATVRRLERLDQGRGPAARRRELLARLEELGPGPLLAPDFTERRSRAQAGLDAARREAGEQHAALGRLDDALAALPEASGLAHGAERIEALYAEAEVHAKARRDSRGLEDDCRRLEARAREMLRALRPDLPLERAGELRLPRREQERIHELIQEHAALGAALDAAREEAEAAAEEQERARAARAALPPAPDAAALAGALRRAEAQGDLEERLARARAQCAALGGQAETGAGALGLWPGPPNDLKALVALAVPPDETLRRFEAREAALAAERRDATRELETQARELEARRAELEALRGAGDVPTEADLLAARELRDRGWALVRARLSGSAGTGEAEFVARLGASGLEAAQEAAVRRADELADRLRREAGRVAEQAALLAAVQRLESGLDRAGRRLGALDAEAGALGAQWKELWAPLGVDPLPAREMLAWTEARREVCRIVAALGEAEAEAATLEERAGALDAELRALLAAAGAAPSAAAGLGALADAAGRIARDAEALRAARERAGERAADLERRARAAQSRQERAREALDRWADRWAGAVAPLGLPAAATPAQARGFLDDVAELLGVVAEWQGKARRVADMARDYEDFCTRVAEAVARLAPELGEPDPIRAAVRLFERLAAARDAARRRADLRERRQEAAARHTAALGAEHDHARTLERLCAEAGCAAPDELPRAEENARERARAREALARAEEALAALATGEVAAFAAQALEEDPDALAAGLGAARAEVQALGAEHDALLQELGGVRQALTALDGTSRAARVAERAQGVLGRLQADVDRHVRLRLAALILGSEIERYRRDHQGPVLERAGGLFAALTLGSFAGLEADFDERGEPVLQGVRPGGERVRVPAMSDGTRDQLFLALRLAGLHRFLDANAPLPFVVDDILVHFDDQRARATLGALAELARRTQVVFFTHHEHLLPLAQAAVPAPLLTVARLGRD